LTRRFPGGNDRKKGKNGRGVRVGNRLLSFGFAQGRNDSQKSNGKNKGKGGVAVLSEGYLPCLKSETWGTHFLGGADEQQIPRGNDSQKSKGKSIYRNMAHTPIENARILLLRCT
jgi:hypothetical protein